MTGIGPALHKHLLEHVMVERNELHELHQLFGDGPIPNEVINMIWDDANSHLTIGEMRAKIRRFAQRKPLQEMLEHCEAAHGHVVAAYALMQSQPSNERSTAIQTRATISINELASAIARLKTMIRELS